MWELIATGWDIGPIFAKWWAKILGPSLQEEVNELNINFTYDKSDPQYNDEYTDAHPKSSANSYFELLKICHQKDHEKNGGHNQTR